MWRYVIIVAPEAEHRGTMVHYKTPRPDKVIIPLCKPMRWKELKWMRDPVQGLGADICGRCERIARFRELARIKKNRQARLKRYYANKEEANRKAAEYRKTASKALRIQRKQLYQRAREKELARQRKYEKEVGWPRRKERYHNDPEYRERIKAKNRRNYHRRMARKRAEKSEAA